MKKYKLQIILVVAVLIAITSYFLLFNNNTVVVSTMKSYKGSISKTIEVSGIIDSNNIEVIHLEPNMDVVKTYVKENDFVEQNQTLIELDAREVNISLEKTKLNLEEAIADLNEITFDNSDSILLSNSLEKSKEEYNNTYNDLEVAKEDLKKAEILYNESVISKKEYEKYISSVNDISRKLKTAELNINDASVNYNNKEEQKKQNISSLERQIKSLNLDIESLTNKIEDTKIYSSTTGFVTEFPIKESKKTLTEDKITIHGTASYVMTALVPQPDAVLVKEGQKSILAVDGLNASYEGVVSIISKTAETDGNNSYQPKVKVEIEITDADDSIIFGYESF